MAQTHKKIRVLICNKHTLFRDGIKALLEKETFIEIVGEADTASDAIKQLERLKPDVVLMDVGTPDLTGFEATQRIKALDPEVKVLILSLYEDETLMARCMEAGASGYLRKDDRHRICKLPSMPFAGPANIEAGVPKLLRVVAFPVARKVTSAARERKSEHEKQTLTVARISPGP